MTLIIKNKFTNYIIISCILLFGCANKQSITINDIDIEMPDKWQTNIPDYEPLTGNWWALFNDPELEIFIEEIMQNSPDIKTILNNRKMAYQNAKINGSGIFPTLNPSVNSMKSQQNLSGFGFGEFFSNINGSQDSSSVGSNNDKVLTFDSESYGLSLNLQWEIDVWGRALNGRRAAFKDYESLNYELSYLAFSTIIRATQTYFQAVEASAQLKIAEDSYASLEKIRDLVQDRFKRGIKSSLDFRLAETSVSTAKIAIEDRIKKGKKLSVTLGAGYITNQYEDMDRQCWRFVKLCKDIGLDYSQLRPSFGFFFDYKKITQQEWQTIFDDLKKYENDNFKVVIDEGKFSKIFAGKTGRSYSVCHAQSFKSTSITALGGVYICCSLSGKKEGFIGNIKKESFTDIWNGDLRQNILQGLDVHRCPKLCVGDNLNEFLEDYLSKKPEHVNFL